MIPAMAIPARARAVLAASATAVLLLAAGRVPLTAAESDLDAFMRQVMARRDDNWKKLQQYVLDERETAELRGPGHAPLWGEQRDYAWYIRDGFFVRSPVKVNGATVSEGDRRKYEEDFLRRAQQRDRRAQRGRGGAEPTQAPDAPPTDVETLIKQTREPDFISSSYFLRFHFDEGRYALVGRETLDGHEVLRVEYYPATLFSERPGRGRGRGREDEDKQLLTMMDKASRVTLWIDQPSHQIVKYTFENVTANFVPTNILAKVGGVGASMTMGQPFPDVWLPSDLDMAFTLTFAVGDVDFHYHLAYSNYRQADAKATLVPPDGR